MLLLIANKALRELGKLPKDVQTRMRGRFWEIAADPFASLRNVERLQGEKNWFRLRVGDWRAVYKVDTATQTVTIEHIAKRGEVYR
jgi:mRNA interferase RelE/StbE